MQIRVLLEWDEEAKAYSATCPELNFISSCGDTKEEALSNLKEAINLLIEPIPSEMFQGVKPSEEVKLAI